jgi:GT2 family glycosyltransferase
MSLAQITIALPTFNRRHVLQHTLPIYLALAQRYPLIVIDDGSHDNTATWLASHGLRVIRHQRRLGLPAARNTALRSATTPWVFFGEDDVLLAVDHPQRLLTWAEQHPGVGAVAGQLFAATEWTLPEQRPPNSSDALINQERLTGDFAAILDYARPFPSLHACALVDRQAVLAIGGYDTRLTDSAFREESDCYARLWKQGRSCWLIPDAWAIHVRHRLGGGARGKPSLAAKLRNRWSYWRNDARFIARHHALWQRWCPNLAGPGMITARAALTLLRNLMHQASGS